LTFAIGTLLTWLGYGAALRALYLGLKAGAGAATGRGASVALVIAALSLFIGGRMAAVQVFSVPLVWFVMPFAAWALALSLVLMLIRAQQAVTALNPSERSARIKAAVLWAMAAVAFVIWYRMDEQAEVRIIRGAIPLSRDLAIGMMLLAVAAVVLMVVTARAAKLRGATKTVITHIALITGSILFGIPFAWLVITSFKEDIDMSSPNGIVWIPRVQETVPYYSKTKPRYSTNFNGTRVQGLITSQTSDG
jgi:multiple sugar transport system permease protein